MLIRTFVSDSLSPIRLLVSHTRAFVASAVVVGSAGGVTVTPLTVQGGAFWMSFTTPIRAASRAAPHVLVVGERDPEVDDAEHN